MHALFWIALLLIVLWVIGWLGFNLAGFLIHLLLIVGLILLLIVVMRWLADKAKSSP